MAPVEGPEDFGTGVEDGDEEGEGVVEGVEEEVLDSEEVSVLESDVVEELLDFDEGGADLEGDCDADGLVMVASVDGRDRGGGGVEEGGSFFLVVVGGGGVGLGGSDG